MEDDPIIGVYARIEDAAILAEAGRYEGALLLLLVAVAATSRKRYRQGTKSRKDPSKTMDDKEAFETFLRDEIWRLRKGANDTITYRGGKVPIEEFLYIFLRCHLVHEGQMPIDLQPVRNEDVITIDNKDGTGISITPLFLTRINDVIWRAPENSYPAMKSEMESLRQRILNHPLNQKNFDKEN